MQNFKNFILYIIHLNKEIPAQDGSLTNIGIFPITEGFLRRNKHIFQEILSPQFGRENDIATSLLIGYKYSTQDFSFDNPEEYGAVMSKILETEKSVHVFRHNTYFLDFITCAKLYHSKYKHFVKPILYPIFMVEQFKKKDVEEGQKIYNDFINELNKYQIREKTTYLLEEIKERN